MPIIEFSDDDLRPREDPAVTRDKIDAVKEHGRHLNRWQREFLESIDEQHRKRGFLTDKHQETLDSLYDQKLF